MRKLLLSVLSIFAVASAYAGVDGTYVADVFAGVYIGDDYKFSSGTAFSNETAAEDPEEAESWEVTVVSEDGAYIITDLIGWDENLNATYQADANTLTVAAGQAIYEDESGYIYYICGGLDGYNTAKGVMDYCDANSGWIPESRGLKDIVINVVDGKLIVATPILVYVDYYPGYGYHGMPYCIFSQLEMSPVEQGNDFSIEGDYEVIDYGTWYVGNDYTFASGEYYSSLDYAEEGEDDEPWIVNIKYSSPFPQTSGLVMLNNLLGWNDDLIEAAYNADTDVITIPAGMSAYTDGSYWYYVCGGFGDYTKPADIMAYCDANSGWIYNGLSLVDIVFNVEDDCLVAQTPILVFVDYYPGTDYWGCAYSLTSPLVMKKKADGIQSVVSDNSDAPVEYYNLQGIRLSEPAPGQFVIKRQGNQTSKMIIR